MSGARSFPVRGFSWRHALLASVALGTLALVFALPPIAQSPGFHDFADRRAVLGVPNFWDVVSNLPFLLVGIAGLRLCASKDPGGGRPAWLVLFAGVALVAFGSVYYHWDPRDATLVWDRLPITVAFVGLFVALLAEYVDARLVRVLLVPMLLLGAGSVFYWQETGDLRWYAWIQGFPLLCVPLVMLLYSAPYTRAWLLPVALFWYVIAKVSEGYDAQVFALTGSLVSGHSLKHLLAAVACLTILWMLRTRQATAAQGRV